MFGKKKLDDEQFDQLAAIVKQKFLEEIGTQILRKNAEAFNKVLREAAEEKLEGQSAKLCQKLQEQFNQWAHSDPLMKRMAKCEAAIAEIEKKQISFQTTIETQIERMLDKLDQIMEGQRPQPNAALQTLQAQLDELESRITRLEITGKPKAR